MDEVTIVWTWDQYKFTYPCPLWQLRGNLSHIQPNLSCKDETRRHRSPLCSEEDGGQDSQSTSHIWEAKNSGHLN